MSTNPNVTPANELLVAMEDAERAVPYAYTNQIVMSQTLNRKRLMSALGNPIADGAEKGPLLRSCDPALDAYPLIPMGLMAMDTKTSTVDCERCTGYDLHFNEDAHDPGIHRLKVGIGASIVLYHVCGRCKEMLDEYYVEPRLVWDY